MESFYYFFIAIVCDDELIERRMRVGRGVTDENWVKSSLEFNRWLKENADKTEPKMTLLDNTTLTPEEAAVIIDQWILNNIKGTE